MRLVVTPDGVIRKFGNQLAVLGEDAPRAMQRALTRTGDMARTQVVRALTRQTGLPRAVIVRAVQVTRPSFGNLAYIMTASGGNIRLRHFKARETRRGVSATPFGKRTVFAGTFMKAGWVWGKRVVKPNWNGQVFRRTGSVTGNGMDEFEVVRSGVYIPREMAQGATEQAWRDSVDKNLEQRMRHEIGRLLPR